MSERADDLRVMAGRHSGGGRRPGRGPDATGRRAAIPRRPDDATAPLALQQRPMWLIDQLTPGNAAYNLPWAVRLRGKLDVAALEAALNAVVARHEALRTTIELRDGEPLQRIHPSLRVAVRIVMVDDVPADKQEARVRALASAEVGRPFTLAQLPLLRVTVFRLDATHHVLVVNVHHIVFDGGSMAILMQDLDACYRACVRGRAPSLPALDVQYGDYAAWQRRSVEEDSAYARQVEYWRGRLAGIPAALNLPTDLPPPPAQSFRGASAFFDVPADVSRGLRELGMRAGCTPFMVLCTAYQLLLARYGRTDDLVIGVPISSREPPEAAALVGNFITTVAMRCEIPAGADVSTLLARTREVTLDALANATVPLDEVLRRVRVDRTAAHNPVFQVLLEVQGPVVARLGDLEAGPYPFSFPFAQFDLALHLREEGDGYAGRLEYCTDLFAPETAGRLAKNFVQVLRGMIADPAMPASAVPLMTEAERAWVAARGAGPIASHAETLFPLLRAQRDRTPDRVAAYFRGEPITRRDLHARAARVTAALASRGIGAGQRVGLCVKRSVDMLAALLGIVGAGAAYVPLDPDFPAERLRFMAADAQLALLLEDGSRGARLGVPRTLRMSLADAIGTAPDPVIAATSGPETPPAPSLGHDASAPGDPAYVIYTSGSTGRPKGVVIPHRALANFLGSMSHKPGLGDRDVIVAVTTLSFDIAVLELLLPLVVGATVVIASRDDARDGRALRRLLDRHGATVMQATPLTWRLLLEAGWSPPQGFKALVGGEAMPKDLADSLIRLGVEVWNMYGPTETTVWSTCARVTDTDSGIAIGAPIDNTIVRVLDGRLQWCPVGVPGELYIGGAGVASGYWDRDALTARRFVADPWAGAGGRMYRTGDLARWRSDGTLECLGRLDDQVKVRGVRVEPREVEATLARHPAVRDSAVVAWDEGPGRRTLVAYIMNAAPPAHLADELRATLRDTLPDYMVPSRFIMVDRLPRTANGKLDRKRLPPPVPPSEVDDTPATAPQTPTEALVANAFGEVLGRAAVDLRASFFDLGGDSLMAARLMLRIRAKTAVDIPLRVLFERQTPGALAEAIDALTWVHGTTGDRRAWPVGGGEREEFDL